MPKQAPAEAQEDVYLDVEIGNSHALEAYRVPNDETLYFRLQEPQGVERVTHARVLRSDPVERQVVDVQGILSHSLQSGEKPDWVECSSSFRDLGSHAVLTEDPCSCSVSCSPPS
jgi:hypothetical protein